MLEIRKADMSETPAILEGLKEAAGWLLSREIRQWRPERFALEEVAAKTEQGVQYIACMDGLAAGSFILQPPDAFDRKLWPDAEERLALYIHRLTVRRAYGGRGIGRRMLAWAQERTAAEGLSALRLDCMRDNAGLNAYYREAGFIWRGEKEGKGWQANLYEIEVRPANGYDTCGREWK